MAYCVNVKSKEFISLCKDLNVSSGDLALIVYEYQNSFNTDEFPSKEFILNKLQGIPTKMSNAQIEVYNKYYSASKVFDTEQELDKAKTKALLFFNPEALFSYKNYDGKYVLNVASPDFTEATNDNIYYQQDNRVNFIEQQEKLRKMSNKYKSLNRLGSIKKIKEHFKQQSIAPEVYNLIIKAVELNPSLLSLSPIEVFNTIVNLQHRDLLEVFNNNYAKQVNKELEKILISILEKYKISIQEVDMERFGGALGAFDILNKVIYLANSDIRNATTFPEEFAHAFVELMGSPRKPNKNSPENTDFKFLMDNIENTSIYKQTFEEYKNIYIDKKTGEPDIYKIKKEAIGKALAAGLLSNFENQKNENKEKSFWEKLKVWFQNIINKFKGVEYASFDSLINKISKEILNGDTSRLNKVDASNYKLLDYAETLANQTKQDGGKSLQFLKYFSKLGNIITGSLSYRYQGTVYRGSLDSLHDIDMIVGKSVHNININNPALSRIKYIEKDKLLNYFSEQPYFKKILADYPKMKLAAAYKTGDFFTINAVYSENEALSNRFIALSGGYANRLNHFTEEERKQIYLFDFFLKNHDDTQYIASPEEFKLAKWDVSFKEKQFSMGRAKGIFDYQMWEKYEQFKDSIEADTDNIMYQTNNQTLNIWAGTNENADLSNFAERPFIVTSVGIDSSGPIAGNFKTVEGAFQAQKLAYSNNYTDAQIEEIKSRLEKASGSQAKQIGRSILGLDIKAWNSISSVLMKNLLLESFEQNPKALQRLLATGNITLTHTQEKSKWGTEFPRLLMEVREELRQSQLKSQTKFSTSKSTSYPERTKENAEWSDITLDFTESDKGSGGNRELTKQVAGKKYIHFKLHSEGDNSYDANEILDAIKQAGLPTKNIKLNIAGSEIGKLKETQERYNEEMERILNDLLALGVSISEIRTGGQTGIDEAGIIAAQRLGIPNEVHTTSDFKFRDESGKDISNEKAFKARFQQGQDSQGEQPVNTSKLQEAADIVDEIKEDSNLHIRRDDTTHIYYIDGKPADSSVTKVIHGDVNLGEWGIPSTTIGSSLDLAARAFFIRGTIIGENIPNMTKEQIANLEEDLIKLRDSLDKKFGGKLGESYNVVTEEILLAGKYRYLDKEGKPVSITVGGTMDMLIYDKDGNFYIYDFKTKRTPDASKPKEFDSETAEGYYKQLSMYKAILEANYPQLKGKIKELNLIRFDTYYPTPIGENNGEVTYIKYGDNLYYSDNDTSTPKPIQTNNNYSAPRLSIISENGIIVAPEQTLEGEYSSYKDLDKSERELMEEEVGGTTVEEAAEQTSLDRQISDLYNPGIMSASERQFLGNTAMYYASFIITHLQTSRKANSKYFGNSYMMYNFTAMSRREIIDTIGISTILDYVKETYFNSELREDIEDFETLNKLDVAYNNWGALTMGAYSKLITLEDTTVVKARPDEVTLEGLYEEAQDIVEGATLEEKEREYWQLGQRQISARSSIMGEVKRAIERMPIKDANGDYVLDEYGYGFMTFMDSGEATNRLLDWCSNCTTIEEMEEVLADLAATNPWLNGLLDKMQKEPFRSLFFHSFRKQHTKYSIVTVDRDSKGKVSYNIQVINTKEADKAILEDVVTMYHSGLMKDIITPLKGSLEGKGKVNVKSVTEIKNKVASLLKTLQDAHSDGNLEEALTREYTSLINILKILGIPTDAKVLKEAFAKDSKKKNFNNTNIFKILRKVNNITDALLDNKDRVDYNPVLKGTEGNVYSNYKAIVEILSNYMFDSIEASTYENGKMYYSYNLPSYLGKLMINLKDSLGDERKFKEFIENEYGRYRWFKDGNIWNNEWLRQLVSSKEARDKLDYKVQLSYDKTDYTELSELSYTLSLMQEYFYDTSNKGDRKLAWYRVPILANKPSSEFIRFTRYSGKHYKEDIKRGLLKVFNQEVMRIKTVLERATNPNINKIGVKEKITYDIKDGIISDKLKNKIKNGTLTVDDFISEGKSLFKGSGAEFKFLDALNNEILDGTELGAMIVEKINGTEVNEDTFIDLFNRTIDAYMDEIVAKQKAEWEYLGLYDLNESSKEDEEPTFKYLSNLGKTREAVDNLLEEYIWNDMFATINIIELTATDLAYYRNVEDFQKRYAQVHSPSMRLNPSAEVLDGSKYSINNKYSADGMERTIYLQDNISESDIIENVGKAFDNKIASTSGVEKNYLKLIKSQVLDAFKEVNWADAQGYSSPTSYRKKMGMMGKWDETMEEAYGRIVKGNYNINDLQIVWQPFKPFVYSQVAKSSGAETMSEIKVPIQNKNSEYLLFLADAIMRGDNQYNKLVAIFDFMEDSAYDGRVSDKGKVVKEGTYNGVGIDTVQFVSAVNSGSMGAININDINTYEDIKQRLHNAVYYNADKSEVADNAMDRYNDQVVHTISFEDYGIQQEVPAHFSDHEQLMGSQIRILSVSDITPNTSFNVNGETLTDKELVNEYQSLIAENIRESFDLLIKEFNLKGTRKEKNRALSDLLIKTILKDQRYGSDLLRACSLDANGEFNIPPSDPIHSNRIQQLLNSIIKNRINKQKISGGPVVQASSFGLAEDLKIVYNEDGTIKYFECYLPIPSEELERALTRPDGTIMDIDEAIEKGIMTEDMRKVIGYRIPTEDKYSMAPLMIKGFLPKAAGEAVMLPKEITTLSGSDFDIDKMYIMLKSVKYSKEYFDRKAFKSAIRESLKEKGYSDEYINNFIKGNATEDSVDIYLDKIENGVAFTREDKEGNELEDRKGLALYDAYIANKNRFTKKLESKVIEGTDTREGRNNRIFDLQWAVLTNEDTAIKLFNPGSFDVQKKSARIINVLKSTNKYSYEELSKMSLKQLEALAESGSNRNIIFSGTQVYFHKQNMTAGKLIGIFANNNTSHAFISMQDISLNLEEGFMFNNVPVDNMRNNKLDALHGKDGSLISKTIAGFLAASVDAVKDPVLNAMNLNTFTANTTMLLVRLGFDSDSIGLFLTQPIIEKVTREYFKRSNEGYVTIDEVIKEFLPNDEDLVKSIARNLENTAFTKRDLAEGIMEGVTDSDFQISVLMLFSKLSTIAQDLNSLTFLTKFNSVTNAVGPTIADTFILRDRYERFMDKMKSDSAPFNVNAFGVIDNSPILKAFYETTVADGGASELIFREYFPHYTQSFMYTLEQLKGSIKGNIDAKTINKLVNDFVLYNLTLGDKPVIDSSEKNRRKFIKNFVDFYKNSVDNISNNDLISNIKFKSPDRKCPVPTLEVKTGGYSIDLQERIKSSWGDLILNPETRQLGKDLFFYNIFRSGFGFSPKTFGHLASVDVRMMIDGYINAIRNNITNESFNTNEFLYQFFRNHVQEYKLVPKLKTTKGVNISNRTNIKGENIITFASDKWKGLDTIIVKRSSVETTFAPVIVFNNKVYMNPRTNGYSVSYTETTALGNTNNFLEYGPYGSNMKSVLNTKETRVDENKETLSLEPQKDTVKEVDIKDNTAERTLDIITSAEKQDGITLKQYFSKISSEEDKTKAYKVLLNQLLEELGITEEDAKSKIVEEQLKNKIKGLC